MRANLKRIISAIILILVFVVFQDSAVSEDNSNHTTHSIQKGETLWHLSISQYGNPKYAYLLAEYNNIANVKRIPVGTEIKLPNVLPYKAKRGDTLSGISKKILGNSKKYKALAEYNDIANPNFIKEGAFINIPIIPSIEVAIAEKRIEKEPPPVVEEKPVEEEEILPEKPELPEVEEKIEEVVIPSALEEIVEEKPEEKEIIPPPIEEEIIKPEEKIEEVVIPPSEKIEEKELPSVEEITVPPVEEVITKPEEIEETKPSVETEVTIPETQEQVITKETITAPETVIEKVTEPKKPEKVEPVDPSETTWVPEFPWALKTPKVEMGTEEPEKILSLREAISAFHKRKIIEEKGRDGRRSDERGVKLPMQSLLQIEGYKSVMIEYSKVHYFGDSDINRYSGYYSSGLDYGGYGSSNYGYDSYGSSSYGSYDNSYGSSNYGSSYGNYGSYGSSYGSGYGDTRSSGVNIQQELDVHLHGRIGPKTHVDVDYNDTGRSQFGGMGQKQQKIRVWYQGDRDEIIQKAAFGDISLSLPSSRFINVSRNLFGAELVAKLGDIRLTMFGSRTQGIKETWSSRGQSRQAGGGIGSRIMDINYIKERYYALNIDADGIIHESYLPIETGSEVIYIDDGIGTNNDSGISTAQGYFNFQYPGDDYNIDYATGQIEFLKNVSSGYKIIVAYSYRGEGGGTVGKPEAPFEDNDNDGVIDEIDGSDPVGYIGLKPYGMHGSELKNVYSLGNRNINRRNFSVSIWREGGTDSFQTDEGAVRYSRIFGLDSDGDGLVDPELVDFEKGVLTFRSPTPFIVDDPASPYYKYRDQLNNADIYTENPQYSSQKYVIQADYSYQTPSFYIGRLNIIEDSEVVKVNGRALKRNVDYIMIYEVGSVEIFRELDEYDEITIDYEYMPFGGQFQQTIAGVWAEYSYVPKKKEEAEKPTRQDGNPTLPMRDPSSPYGGDSMSPFSQDSNTYGASGYDNSYGSSYGNSYNSGYGSGYDSYGSSPYSSSYGGYGGSSGYDSYSSYGGRRGSSGRSSSARSRSGSGYRSGTQGLKLSFGYIYNTGERTADIPDVNSAPSRLQALALNASWGHEFDIARVIGLMPLVKVRGRVPWSIYINAESAYSRNNANSVGYAMIDSMEGAKESSRTTTYKYSWRMGSVPVESEFDAAVDNRVIFPIAKKDEEASYGNYMKNREVAASNINSLSQILSQYQVMEIGYDLNDDASWGALSYPLSPTGSDFSEYEFMEIWLKVEGDKNINLNIDLGTISEDADDDFRLDSEDLPNDLIDANGDHKIDILDISKENLPEKDKYKGNGSLDVGEDIGWSYTDYDGVEINRIGKGNTLLDSEDLDGDLVLDATNSYYEFSIPLNDIPPEWIRRENKDSGWIFLSIPFEKANSQGRSPSWAVVKHARIWLEKNVPGTAVGKLQWYSLAAIGNRWDKGLIVDTAGKLVQDTSDKILVGTKNNYEFDDYLKEYEKIKDNKEFKALHPYVESAFSSGTEKQEQSLTLTYDLLPEMTGYTMRELPGIRRGDGQDFSKHKNIRMWMYGDSSGAELTIRLGSNIDDFGAGSPITTQPDDQQGTGYYSYYSYSQYGGTGYYEYKTMIDFSGWKLITISLEDNDDDGQPDSLTPVNNPSITNIGNILLAIKNVKQSPINGEIWINEIHLNEPYIKTGWAGRFDLSTKLADIFSLRAGYAKQDQNFENSAGQTGRTNQYSMGYSTNNYDYNVNTELSLIQWLPVSFDLSHRETESISQLGMISSYNSGKTATDNRTFSINFDRARLPSLSFSYDNQETWNELRGQEHSNLYNGGVRYGLGSKLTLNLNYNHEKVDTDTKSSTSTSSYYYGSYGDSILDGGSISLQITPSKSFSINPSYDIRREMEKATATDGKELEWYTIAGRDQRLSLRPVLRQFYGVRPSLNGRYDFREDWIRGEKDVSMSTSFSVGLNFNFRSFFAGKPKKDSAAEDKSKKPKDEKKAKADETQTTEKTELANENTESTDTDSTIQESESDPLNRYVDPEERHEIVEDMMQEERGNWIESEANEMKRKMQEMEQTKGSQQNKGILRRTVESFTFNTDFGLDINDYLRQLKPDMSFFDIINLEPESEYRNRSTRGRRFSIRSNVDPFTWSSLGFNMSLTNRFTKSMGTASDSDSKTIGGDVKFMKNKFSLMLKYDMNNQDSSNASGPISNSLSHNPSITFRSSWASGIGTSFGLRTTIRDYQRGDVETKSLIIAPNFNIDYDWNVDASIGLPFTSKRISMNQNLDMSNTISAMVRREKLGVNRDEKSEQYGTSLDVSYDLRQRIRASIRLSVDYNHDRVQEGADYLAVSGALMLRGEFR